MSQQQMGPQQNEHSNETKNSRQTREKDTHPQASPTAGRYSKQMSMEALAQKRDVSHNKTAQMGDFLTNKTNNSHPMQHHPGRRPCGYVVVEC